MLQKFNHKIDNNYTYTEKGYIPDEFCNLLSNTFFLLSLSATYTLSTNGVFLARQRKRAATKKNFPAYRLENSGDRF